MNKTFLAITLASLLTPISYVHAQEANQDADNATPTETMVVTANRFSQPENKVLAATQVITKDEIEASQAKSLTEILRRSSGIEITQSGGRGTAASIFMRGTNSNHTLILLDGIRINTFAGGYAFNHIPVNSIERIEIIRGPAAAQYGSDTIGGVINIITRTNVDNSRNTIAAGIGSQKEKNASASFSNAINDKSHLKLAVSTESREGYDFKSVPDGTDYGYDANSALVNYQRIINDEWSLFTSAHWFESTSEYNGANPYNFWAEEHAALRSRNSSVSGQIRYQKDQLESFVNISYQQTKNLDYLLSSGLDKPSSRSEVTLTTLQWANKYQLSEQTIISGGIDWTKEKLAKNALSFGSPNQMAGESRSTVGVYESIQSTFNRLTLEGNIRVDKYKSYDDYATWSLASAYQFDDYHQLRVGYGTAFKAPTYSALFTNPDLQPEESKNLEVSFKGVYALWDWSATAYDNKVENLNVWYSEPGNPMGRTYNTDARIKGVEFNVGFNTWLIHHSIVADFKDHKDDNGTQLARRAKENYKWIADLSIGKFDFSTTYIYTGKRLDLPTLSPTSDDYLDSYQLFDFAATYWVTNELALKARVDNVFNEQYETAKGYTSPERTYYANVAYTF